MQVVRAAFSDDDRDGQEEVDVVTETWAMSAAPDDLELIAIDDDVIVGYVLAGTGDLGGRSAIAVAPLAVTPSRQGDGIGSALMNELLRRAEHAGFPLVAVLGNPAYYRRLGFEASGPLGIWYLPVGRGDPHFQVCRLSRYDPSHRGEFTYCWER